MIGGSCGKGKDKYILAEKRARKLGDQLCVITKYQGHTDCHHREERVKRIVIYSLIVQRYEDIIFGYKEGQNPYLALLALADTIVVTNDSVSMVRAALQENPFIYLPFPIIKQIKRAYHS